MPESALKQRLITADEYHAMARAGIFSEDDRVELIDGKIIEMSPVGDLHVACVNRLNRLFISRADPSIVVSVQNPVGRDYEIEQHLYRGDTVETETLPALGAIPIDDILG